MARRLQELQQVTTVQSNSLLLIKDNRSGYLEDYHISTLQFKSDLIYRTEASQTPLINQIPRLVDDGSGLPALPAISAKFLTDLDENNIGVGNNTDYGLVKLSDSITSSSDAANGFAASPYAVKQVNDLKPNKASASTISATWIYTANQQFNADILFNTGGAKITNAADGVRVYADTGRYLKVGETAGIQYFDGSATQNVWHQGNDGIGSGLDADLLDGYQATAFPRKAENATIAGAWVFSGLATFGTANFTSQTTSGAATFQSGLTSNSVMTLSYSSKTALVGISGTASNGAYIRDDTSSKTLYSGGTGATAPLWDNGTTTYNIWHQGNDGAGSGLDADTVDGIQAANLLKDNVAVQVINAGNTTGSLTLQAGDNFTTSFNLYEASGQHGLRLFYDGTTNTAKILTREGGVDTHKFYTTRGANTNIYLAGTVYVNSDSNGAGGGYRVLTTNDTGSGKGLDADTVDGIQGSSIVQTSRTINGYSLASNISLTYADVGALGATQNAVSASKLLTARTIALSGDVSGSVLFDGSANVTITATVADDSHNHIIANVDGLQAALDGKLSTTGKAADSDKLDGLNSSQFVRSDTADTITAPLTFSSGPQFINSNGILLQNGNTDTGSDGSFRYNTTEGRFEGRLGGRWKGISGGGGVEWLKTEVNTTMEDGQGYLVAADGLTLTLPTGRVGDTIGIGDYNGLGYSVTVTATDNIMGLAEDFVFNTKNANLVFSYVDATVGWILTQGFGENEAPQAISNHRIFSNVAGRTSFGIPNNGSLYVDVFYNGTKLVIDVDYTVDSVNDTVTLTDPVILAEDVVEIYAWNQALVLNAKDIGYDNTTSGLTATSMQAAIDELLERIVALETP